MNSKDKIKLIRAALSEHNNHWDALRPEMKRLDNLYANKFWASEPWHEDLIRVEVAEGYGFVEGYVASLFSQAPSISVEADLKGEGNEDIVKELADRFLYDTFKQMEACTRQALIYTNSFIKIAPRESNSVFDMATLRALPPWEVIVDRDAVRWDDQRFVGHVYYMTIPDAKAKWGSKDYTAIPKTNFLEARKANEDDLPNEYLYIQVVEFYNMIEDTLIFWSPQWKNGESYLEENVIPIRTHDDKPLPAIASLYFVREPSVPLAGISSLTRVYDQAKEKNVIRSFWANAIRRDTRQYLYKEGAFDDEQLVKMSSGIDGAFIGVDEESLEGLIKEIPNTPIPYNHDKYLAMIEDDLNKGTVMAPFTRGEGQSGATATEIRAQYAYSSSEVGRLARERDAMIEEVANIYIRMMSTLLGDEGEVISMAGKPALVGVSDLEGKFKYHALDMASTPLAEEMKQQQFISLIPVLQGVGITPEQIKKQLVVLYGDILPIEWGEEVVEEAAPEAIGAPGAGLLGEDTGAPPIDGIPGVPVPEGLA